MHKFKANLIVNNYWNINYFSIAKMLDNIIFFPYNSNERKQKEIDPSHALQYSSWAYMGLQKADKRA